MFLGLIPTFYGMYRGKIGAGAFLASPPPSRIGLKTKVYVNSGFTLPHSNNGFKCWIQQAI